MENKILLKDIVDILNSKIELYYKGQYVCDFTNEELKQTLWINDRVVSIETDEESIICLYLSDYNRAF